MEIPGACICGLDAVEKALIQTKQRRTLQGSSAGSSYWLQKYGQQIGQTSESEGLSGLQHKFGHHGQAPKRTWGSSAQPGP